MKSRSDEIWDRIGFFVALPVLLPLGLLALCAGVIAELFARRTRP